MSSVFTDITPLFSDDLSEEEINPNQIPLAFWYHPNEIPNLSIDEEYSKALNEFDEFGFSEYQPIAMSFINYFDKIAEEDSTELYICNIMVSTESKFSKGHHGEKGFVRLFAIVLKYSFGNLMIKHISINAKLVAEKFPLTNGQIAYPDKLTDQDSTIKNDIDCTICLSNIGKFISTPCKHEFHLDCLKCTPGMICPICRTDIKDFLISQGISIEEINHRLERQTNEKEFENFCSAIDEIAIGKLSETDLMRLCMNALKMNNGNVISYDDLIFDMNANASQLFAKISGTNSRQEKGAFIYMYDSPIEFISLMIKPQSPSKAEWIPLSILKDTPIYDVVENRINRIKNIDDEYVVVIMIENVVNAHIVHREAYKGEFAIRIHQRDILNSLTKCIRCRCSGNIPNAPNREYVWARNYLDKLNKKVRRKNNRRNRK
jgi:hypothetical protein